MKLFSALTLKFEKSDWSRNPEFGLIDTLLEQHPELLLIVKEDIMGKEKESTFGRGDVPTAEQIMRAAIYKEMKGLDYRELEYAQSDSRICATFIKLDMRPPFSFQMFQKYISRIKVLTLQKILIEINKIAIAEGYEDVSKLRQDTSTIEANVHYPTNNSLVWDCIKESHRLLEQFQKEMKSFNFRNYVNSAKKTYFKINNSKADRRTELFKKQLITFTKTINQVSNAIKKKSGNWKVMALQISLEDLLPLLHQVYNMTYRKEILKESVPNDKKVFSIYERHTDIIMKGSREPVFGHKINLVTGKSNLILDGEVLRGNPNDTRLYQDTIERVISNYGKVPRDIATDGGFASIENSEYSQKKGIVNIVFNKVVGSLKNIASSLNMATRLKKWRSGIEAVISNLKRGFNIGRCNWKGWEHFQAKVLWSMLGYNFRVMTALTIQRIAG
ncbi:MAG: ISNCY family transposase [Candidatus Levyibacteriota bacterium]